MTYQLPSEERNLEIWRAVETRQEKHRVIGERYGISAQRVRQIWSKTQGRLDRNSPYPPRLTDGREEEYERARQGRWNYVHRDSHRDIVWGKRNEGPYYVQRLMRSTTLVPPLPIDEQGWFHDYRAASLRFHHFVYRVYSDRSKAIAYHPEELVFMTDTEAIMAAERILANL